MNHCLSTLLVIGCLFGSIGCGPGTGKVSGVVTLGDKPIPAGLITFRPDDPAANTVSAELSREGKFTVELPVGACKVCIDNRQHEPQPKPGAGIPSGLMLAPEVMNKLRQAPANAEPVEVDPTKTADAPVARESGLYIKLPEKYYQVETSGLTIEVKPGEQTENIKL